MEALYFKPRGWIRKYEGLKALSLFIILISLASCATSPPKNSSNACDIFKEKKSWYKGMKKSQNRWGVPIELQLAIMHQESRFMHDARPPRKKILWVIPWFRASSAYGYAQVKDETWAHYESSTKKFGASRENFNDASDFIGWYCDISAKKLRISKYDAYNQYLAYHEGHGGYKKKTFNEKQWLIDVARKVDNQSKSYGDQLKYCKGDLDSVWDFWPFW